MFRRLLTLFGISGLLLAESDGSDACFDAGSSDSGDSGSGDSDSSSNGDPEGTMMMYHFSDSGTDSSIMSGSCDGSSAPPTQKRHSSRNANDVSDDDLSNIPLR